MPTKVAVSDQVVVDHIPLARAVAWSFYITHEAIDLEELREEALIGLVCAGHAYDETKGATFGTFAKTVVRNHLIDFCKSLAKMKAALFEVDLSEAEEIVVEDNTGTWVWEEFVDTLTKEEQFIIKLVLQEKHQGQIAAACKERFGGRWDQAKISALLKRMSKKYAEFSLS